MTKRKKIALVCINAALEEFRGPAGAVFPILAQALALTPLPALAFSRAARLVRAFLAREVLAAPA